jgi:hypothetical protein
MHEGVGEPRNVREAVERGGLTSRVYLFLASVFGLILGFADALIIAAVQVGGVNSTMIVLWSLCLIGLIALVRVMRRLNLRIKINASPVMQGLDGLIDFTYVLYLRPFATDERLFATNPVKLRNSLSSLASFLGFGDPMSSDFTWEEHVVRALRRFGQVIAVGRPAELERPPGARRFYLPLDNWKPVITRAMQRARMVVIVVGTSRETAKAEGTLWEYSEALRLLPPSRILLLVCGEPEDYDRFREAAANDYRKRASAKGERLPPLPQLPDFPAEGRRRRAGPRFPIRGMVRFTTGRQAEFVTYPSNGRTSRLHRQARPADPFGTAMEDIERRLPGAAVGPPTIPWYEITRGIGWGVLIWLFIELAPTFESLRDFESWRLEPDATLMLIGLVAISVYAGNLLSSKRHDRESAARVLVRADSGSKGFAVDEQRALRASSAGVDPDRRPPGLIEARPLNQLHRAASQLYPPIVLILYFSREELPLDWRGPLILTMVLFAFGNIWWARQSGMFVMARRLPEDLKLEPATVYFRPFGGGDGTLPGGRQFIGEQQLARIFSAKNGRFWIAGRERDIAAGAFITRMPLPEVDWQPHVTAALPLTKVVVLPAVDAPETVWQFTEAVRILPPARMVLLLPGGKGSDDTYQAFRTSVARALRDRGAEIRRAHGAAFRPPALPAAVDVLRDDRPSGVRLRGVFLFGPGWEPELVQLGAMVDLAELQGRDPLDAIRERLADAIPERP